ncbi:hypothetical protein [Maridesulfovibrio frigidus]|uniref:hypothetical protein n=1 Tax=Maridesulfovibrio frigidus TaxID=340956 RepID=UPI0004E1EE84|nr:hypothetical protein [Maridesulfovibrio frigidus]
MKTALNIALSVALKASPVLLIAAVALFLVLSNTPEDDGQNLDKDPTEQTSTTPDIDPSQVRQQIMPPAMGKAESGQDSEPDGEEFVQIGYPDEISREKLEKDVGDSGAVAPVSPGKVSKGSGTGRSGKRAPPAKKSPAKKTVAKKSPAKKPVRKKSSPEEELIPIYIAPVVVPSITAPKSSSGVSKTPFEAPVAPVEQLEDPMLADVDLTDFSWGEDELIVDVQLRRKLIYRGLFCLEKNMRPFIPVNELCSLLGLAIIADETGARGWYITEDSTFTFDTATGEGTNRRRPFKLAPDEYSYFEEELYIDMERLSELLPLDMELIRSMLVLRITPRETLPYELMKSRKAQELYAKSKRGLLYPINDLDYAALAPPNISAALGAGYLSKDSGDSLGASVSGLFRGDLLFMSTTLYGSAGYSYSDGKSTASYSDFSFAGERRFLDNPYISKLLIGDIPTTSAPLVGGGKLERGLRLSNAGSSGDGADWSRTFTGKALPGWDVELYQNDRRVGFQTITNDGTYSFADIPMDYGVNRIRLQLYGPQGQEEVREEVVTIGASLKKGEIEYDASISQKGTGVFSSEYSKVVSVGESEQGTTRFNGKVSVGLLSSVNTQVGFASDTHRGKERYVTSVGLSGGYAGVLAKGNVGYSTLGSTYVTASSKKKLDNGIAVSGNIMHQFSDKFEESNTRNSVNVSFSDREDFEDNIFLSYSAGGGRDQLYIEDYNNDDVRYALSGSLGLTSDYGYFGTSLTSRFYTQSYNNRGITLGGSTNYSKMFGDGYIRASINYNHDDNNDFNARSASLSGSYRFNKKFRTTWSADKSISAVDYLSLRNTLAYKGKKISPYLTTRWKNDDTFSVFAGFSIGINFDPETFMPSLGGGSAGANCLVYNDKNYNNSFDEGDQPLEDIQVEGVRSRQRGVTDENGRALLTGFAPMKGVDIQVKPDSVQDVNLSNKAGVAIMARKGKIYDLEFPLHVVSEIEGFAYRIKNDEADGKALVRIELVDEKGESIDETWTEGDGFYLFTDVMPGTYTVRVASDFLDKYNYASNPTQEIVITNEANTLMDNLLFYGTEKAVVLLEEKFRNSAKLSSDAFIFTDFSNMDEEAEALPSTLTLVNAALSEASVEEPKGMDTDSKAVATAPAYDKFGLVVDTFISEKSAKRTVEFYRKRKSAELGDAKLTYKKRGDGYVVIVYNLKSIKEMNRMSLVFMCAPELIDISKPGLPEVK